VSDVARIHPTMNRRHNTPRSIRLEYLLWRLRHRLGNQSVLVREIIKAHNAQPARRVDDLRIQGWRVAENV